MRRGGDYSFARPDPRDLVAAGWTFAGRYLSRIDGGKNLTAAEVEALSRAGLSVVLLWENRAKDALLGAAQGTQDARYAIAQARALAAPPGAGIYFAVDWNIAASELETAGAYLAAVKVEMASSPYRAGVYGGFRAVQYAFDGQLVELGFQTYGWSGGEWDDRALLRQVLNEQLLAGSRVDLDEALADDFGQWRLPVTYSPDDLQAVQRYAHEKTLQDWNSLGIAHFSPQGGGYHEGQDLLAAAGRAPGPAYPDSDYSYADARTVSSDGLGRDLAAADRLAGDPDAASAFDLGGAFARFLEFNAWIVGKVKAGDPRARDIRSIIYTPDGSTVRRWDRLDRQPDSGDSSHVGHTHFSFFRDSLGRRDRDDNFLGLLKEFFGDLSTSATSPAGSGTEGDSDMVSDEVKPGTARTMIGLDDVNWGLAKNGPAWLSFVTDPALLAEKGVDQVRLRVAVTDGKGWNVPIVTLSKTGWRASIALDTGVNGVRVDRLDLVATAVVAGGELDKDNDPAGHVEIGYCVMYGPKRA